MTVPGGMPGYFSLTFNTPMPGIYNATLILTAPVTNEKWTYFLEGEATDPPAVDYLAHSVQSGETCEVCIDVPNYSDEEITYQVFTDLPAVQGDPILTVPGGSAEAYCMTIMATLAGSYTGTITFSNSNGNYEWFAFSLDVHKPPKIDCIRVEASVGAAKAVKVHVDNPCNQEVSLTAAYENTTSLLGPSRYILEPHGSREVVFFFCPLEEGSGNSRVILTNPHIGEFWCVLILCVRA